MKQRIRSCLVGCVFAAALMSLIGCGGGKVVVVPNQTPAPAALITPAAPATPVVVTVPTTPPPPSEDVVAGVSPGVDYVWVKGYYNWNGSRYEWVRGTWVRIQQSGSVWVAAHWQPTAGGYIWVPGAWQ